MDALPSDYQEEIDAALRKQRLAQLLLQQSMQPRAAGQMVSGHYVPDSPLSRLAQVFQRKRAMEDDAKSTAQIAAARRRFGQDQSNELAKLQGLMTGTPGGATPNFVMQPGEDGNPEMAHTPAAAANPVAAEQAAQRSQFPQAQALGKALFENRLKREDKIREELLKRSSLATLPEAAQGNFPGVRPKEEFKVESGVPYATSESGVRFTGQPTTRRETIGGKEVIIETTPDGRQRAVAGDQPNVSASVDMGNPTRAVPKIAESQYEALSKSGTALRERAVRSIPRMMQVTELVKQGIVQGSVADARKAVFDFARLLGVGDKEFQSLMDRTGSAEAALAQISAETIKQYGANPSNIDLANQRIASGSIGSGPQSLYLLMQAAQADLINTLRSHEEAVGRFEEDFPEFRSRTRSLRTGNLPKWSVDGEAFNLDESTGLFNFNPNYKGMPAVPQQGVMGPKPATGGSTQLKTIEELRREYGFK